MPPNAGVTADLQFCKPHAVVQAKEKVLHGVPGSLGFSGSIGIGIGIGIGIASLSIATGDATDPFRLYGGSILSWQKWTKTACSCIRPCAALRVPSLRHLPAS